MQFKKATKTGLFARLALIGVSGGGKTYTALSIAQYLARGKRVAVIDTEHGSASKYSDIFDFDVIALESFAPVLFRDGIAEAVKAGYGCIIIDSLSHAWMGKDGVLEYKDEVSRRAGKNSYTAWREAGEEQNALVDAMLAAPIHVIVTMRSKQEYVVELNERGKPEPRKIGLQPVQRDGLEYEFDIVADMSEGRLIVGKSRCAALTGRSFKHASGADFGAIYYAWLTGGAFERACEAINIDPAEQAARAEAAGQTVEQATAQVQECVDIEMDALKDRFAAACAARGLSARDEAKSLVQQHGAKSWAALMPSQIRSACEILEALQPAGVAADDEMEDLF